jgi:glycosyltransferase involved in cell wall biosynthesis
MDQAGPSTVFFAYRDAPERRAALAAPPGSLERYRLFGLDEIAARGATVSHNLERAATPEWARAADRVASELVTRFGGYSGDFGSVFASLGAANAADVILSTVDTVGIPLVLLKRIGLVRSELVYVAIGLPERLVQLRGDRTIAEYRSALRAARTVVSYAESEAVWLREWLGPGASVEFVPFGVDVDAFQPADAREPDVDVVSVGADPRRDFGLLVRLAERRPELRFLVVAGSANAAALRGVPVNVTVEADIPLAAVRDRLAAARIVVLPVRDNSYSGATTVLLQAMAMAKPVVVSRTAAIATGYGLHDGSNCRLVEPGDADALEQAVLETLSSGDGDGLGARARETVVRSLTWDRYTSRLWRILAGDPHE